VGGIEASALTSDGVSLYFIHLGAVWAVGAEAGTQPVQVNTHVPRPTDAVAALAVDDQSVYLEGSRFIRLPLDGGTAIDLAPNGAYATPLAADATDLYWAGDQGALARVAKSGGPVQRLVSEGHLTFAVAVDDQALYWLTEGPATACFADAGGILRIPKTCLP
jgi:hypothetical protein